MCPIREKVAKRNKPAFGPLYQHFTAEEIIWIAESAGVDLHKLSKNAKKLKKEFPLLQWMEPEVIKIYKGKQAEFLLIYMANYGRIHLPLEVTILGLTAMSGNWPEDPDALVNKELLDNIRDFGVNKMDRSPNEIDRLEQVLIQILISVGSPLDKTVHQIDEIEKRYLDLYKKNPKDTIYAIRTRLRTLRTLLAHMGYPVEVNTERGKILTWGRAGKPTRHKDINQAMEYWGADVKIKEAYKTTATKLSHARGFINWLIDGFTEITTLANLQRNHIRAYLLYLDDFKKDSGKHLSVATINHKMQLLNQWFTWLKQHHPNLITHKKLITRLDMSSEVTSWPERISQTEARTLFKIIGNIDETRWFAAKMALILMSLTGLRINSVLTLEYDCMKEIPLGWSLKVYKRKAENYEKELLLTKVSANCIKRLQDAFKDHVAPIYSLYDKRLIRRLFVGKQGASVLCTKNVSDAFKEAQLQAGMVDKEGGPRFTPHDLRRIYASALLSQGATPEEIAALMIQRDVESLFPYEVNNTNAVKVFKKMAESKVLTGELVTNLEEVTGVSQAVDDVSQLLFDVDVMQRQITNLRYKLENNEESFPLMYGTCVCGAEIDCDGDDLTCLGCEKYTIDIGKLSQIENYLRKVFRQKWVKERAGIEMPMLEMRLERVARRVYVEQVQMSLEQALNHLKKVQDEVTPHRGRPKKKEG
ncbi:site-specific integrase [Pelosinus sp. IPA-1]|uniref:tyrosine-type recombinase/integrase n=1 Tax=Pelosinus sp. IPA-1 TaxID=3029569 RepID=UPI0024361D9D|nr:site-specific integrase [Pelosinus sp. IPA-1]GMB02083.1 hypothetical protein PIPA1_48830 [Pelosinus sp. IPA-1]